MIDFRYHLVSIVSIFLALAVGIALGAGPLKGELSDTINTEITNLREDRADLRGELDEQVKAAERRDAFIGAVNAQLLPGRLSGTTVDVVVLPDTDSGLVKATQDSLTTAGATIGATVQVRSEWVDATQAQVRDELASSLAAEVGLDTDSETELPLLARVLGAALQPTTDDTESAAASADVLDKLTEAKFISVDAKPVQAATNVVVLGAAVNTGTPEVDQTYATAYAALALAMDQAGRGTVLAANVGVEPVTSGVSVLTTARADNDLVRGLSTVDDAGIAMGQASIVFALLQQIQGGSGQYGLATDASAPYPPIPGAPPAP